MFGKCVWYQLKSTHNLNQVIYNFHQLFGSELYCAHLTADYNVFEMKDYPIDSFVKSGRIYKTCQNGFYALQQDYFMKNKPSNYFTFLLLIKITKTLLIERYDLLKVVILMKLLTSQIFS